MRNDAWPHTRQAIIYGAGARAAGCENRKSRGILLYYSFRGCIEVMSSVGETLRRERLRKDLGLEQISRETKISTRLLEAIEKDQFDALPARRVRARASCANTHGFWAWTKRRLAAEVEKAMNPSGVSARLRRSTCGAGFQSSSALSEWEGGGRSNSSVLPALAGVVAVMLVCSAVYAWWQRSRRPAASAPPIAAISKPPVSAAKPAGQPAVMPAVSDNHETAPKTDVSSSTPPAAPPGDRPGVPIPMPRCKSR